MTDTLPTIGLGTMGIDDPATVETAIDVGYRHLDTAQIYDNEGVVGDGIAASDVPREDLFVATKVWADKLAPDDVRESTAASRERLGLDRVDLLYVHRPIEAYDPERTLPAFEALREAGRIDHVGLSNFTCEQLDIARDHLDSLFAHQVEYHPLFQPEDRLEYARRHGHWLVAYSPLAGGEVFEMPELQRIAEKHDTSEAAVSIAWLASKDGVVVIPKASSRTHLEANLAAADLELDSEDVAAIDGIERETELFPE